MKKGNLLIVDDEPGLVKILEFTLKKFAENVYSAGTGAEAMAILRSLKIDCVLCDQNLPRMNGTEIQREIRSLKMDTPFVFFSAVNKHEVLVEAAKYGAMDFFFKPEFSGVEKAVQAALNDNSYSPSSDSDYGKVLSELRRGPGLFGKKPNF